MPTSSRTSVISSAVRGRNEGGAAPSRYRRPGIAVLDGEDRLRQPPGTTGLIGADGRERHFHRELVWGRSPALAPAGLDVNAASFASAKSCMHSLSGSSPRFRCACTRRLSLRANAVRIVG
jgi:hypothetical protein